MKKNYCLFKCMLALLILTGAFIKTTRGQQTWSTVLTNFDVQWSSIAYGNNTFVAVSLTGTGSRVMTSTDGTTWTRRSSPADKN